MAPQQERQGSDNCTDKLREDVAHSGLRLGLLHQPESKRNRRFKRAPLSFPTRESAISAPVVPNTKPVRVLRNASFGASSGIGLPAPNIRITTGTPTNTSAAVPTSSDTNSCQGNCQTLLPSFTCKPLPQMRLERCRRTTSSSRASAGQLTQGIAAHSSLFRVDVPVNHTRNETTCLRVSS
jgi:hypothetical protein